MIIDGISVPYNFVNIKGHKIGRLIIETLSRDDKGHLVWNCLCDCGTTKTSKHTDIRAGDVRSCGCLKIEDLRNRGTHKKSNTPEYRAWKRLKGRVCNPNNEDYPVYSELGMEESWKTDFPSFLVEIGETPNPEKRFSVDRIDNTKGYYKGNVRWADDVQQARNKGVYTNNKTGNNGVYLHHNHSGSDYYACTWYISVNQQKTKYFSIKKYGEELAFFLACEYREQQIMLLNLQGAGYSEGHGK